MNKFFADDLQIIFDINMDLKSQNKKSIQMFIDTEVNKLVKAKGGY